MDSPRSRSLGRTCSGCAVVITNGSVSGLCKPCALKAGRSPKNDAKRRAGRAHKLATDPTYREKLRANMRRVSLAASADPEVTARRRERGHYMYAHYLNTPEVRAKIAATRPRVSKLLTERSLAWCPHQYRDDYLFLTQKKRIPSKEAKAMILAQAKEEQARLSPFERQERALAKGVGLAANDAAPSLYAAEKKWTVG